MVEATNQRDPPRAALFPRTSTLVLLGLPARPPVAAFAHRCGGAPRNPTHHSYHSPVQMNTSTRATNVTRQLSAPAYFVAFLLIFIPFFDALMSVAPFHPGAAQWRFAAVGLLSNALMIPCIGVLIAVVTAVTMDHVGAKRAIRIISWIVVPVLLMAIGFFALDSMQTRSAVRAELQLSFLVASVTAVCKLLLGIVAFVLFARASGTVSRRTERAPSAANLLVARDGPSVT